jgi:hypothetical protein
LRQFVNSDGTPSFLQGRGYNSSTGSGNPCANPPTGTFAWNGQIAVADYFFIRGFDADDLTTAHELGHALGLGHGNGLDDNNNVYDDHSSTKCDPNEDENATPFTVMSLGNNKTRAMSTLQRQTSRTLALKYSGTRIDPPAALLDADTVSDQRTDPAQDVGYAGVDLTALAVAENTVTRTTILSHALFGLIPRENVDNRYLVFADLDGDPSTGGAPRPPVPSQYS